MKKTIIASKDAPAALGPYSQAIKIGGFIFCSGQTGIDPATGELKEGIKAQTEQVMKNLESVLKAAGIGFDNVIKTTIFLTSMDNFATVNEIYGSYFTGDKPARSTIAVAGLPKNGIVEIELIAHE